MNITRLKLPALRHFVESTAWAIHPERGASVRTAVANAEWSPRPAVAIADQ
jgi:hypothetical protein